MVKSAELRDLSMDELSQRLDEAKEELFNLRFQRESGRLEDFNRLRMIRRDIARILTVITERKNAEVGQ